MGLDRYLRFSGQDNQIGQPANEDHMDGDWTNRGAGLIIGYWDYTFRPIGIPCDENCGIEWDN